MASLKQFARNILRLSKNIENNVNTTLRKTAIVANQTLILATPVDTGRARGNWFASVGNPVLRTTEDTDKAGGEQITRNNSKISAAKAGQTIFLSNNLPYITELNQGSSSQAPANFVEQAVQVAVNSIRRVKVVRR